MPNRWFESEQTSAGLARVRSWAAALSSRLKDSDVFIHGNTDEVTTSPPISTVSL